MSIEKNMNTRIIHKHDIEANWEKAINFIPKQGEIIIYDIDANYNYERFKIGDGITTVNNLLFITSQADWNQNDKSAPDYIKNRIGYVAPSFTLTFDGDATDKFVYDKGDGTFFVQISTNVIDLPALPIVSAVVSVAGISQRYEGSSLSIVEKNERFEIYADDILGAIYIPEYLTEFELPQGFYVIYDPNGTIMGAPVWVSEIEFGEIVYKIDPKYLPEGGFGYTESNTIENIVFAEQILENNNIFNNNNAYMNYPAPFVLDGDNDYKVICDGITYNFHSFKLHDEATDVDFVAIGNLALYDSRLENTGEPLCIGYIEYYPYVDTSAIAFVYADANATSHTVSISKLIVQDNIHKIDTKYLPDGGFGYEEKYEGKLTCTFDGNLNNALEAVLFNNAEDIYYYFVKLSNNVPSMDSVVGAALTVYEEGQLITVDITEDMIISLKDEGLPAYIVGDAVYVVEQDCVVEGMNATAGIWATYVQHNTMGVLGYVSEFSYHGIENMVHKINPKFLPDGGVGYTEYKVVFPTTELNTTVSEEAGMAGWAANIAPLDLINGQKIKIIWNDVEYDYITTVMKEDIFIYTMWGNMSLVGAGDDTGEPFLINYARQIDLPDLPGQLGVVTKNPTTATLSITTETVHPIDPKYLPEGGFGYTEVVEGHIDITFDGNLNNAIEVVWIDDSTCFAKISNNTSPIDNFIGGTGTISYNGYIISNIINEGMIDDLSSEGLNGYMVASAGFVIYEESDFASVVLTPGIWSICENIDNDLAHTYISNISYYSTVENIKKIDSKYIDVPEFKSSNVLASDKLRTNYKLEKSATIDDAFEKINTILKEKINEKIGKDYIVLKDQVNGFNYVIQMRNGNLVSFVSCNHISVKQQPNTVTYMASDIFDPTGMIIEAIYEDGHTNIVTDFTYDENIPNVSGNANIIVTYTEFGRKYTTVVPITVTPFDPDVALIDFIYTTNDDGTYTITDWKKTYKGVPSTKLVVPNNELIIV